MPKQEPPVIETFSFTFHNVPKEQIGDLHAFGSRLGLNDHEVVLVENVLNYKKRGGANEIKSTDYIMKWSEEHVHFKAIDAVNAFIADGRSKTAAYPAIATLVEKDLLKKVGPGEYARADQKVLPAPAKEKKEKQKKEKPKREHKVFDKTGSEVILSYARRNHGRLNSTKLLEIFDKEGRARNSVSASLDKLLKQKMIKRVGDGNSGQYVLLNKAQTERKKAALAEKTEPPKTNGNGVHPEQTEMTDG